MIVGNTISVADVELACQLLVPWCCLLKRPEKDAFPRLRDHLEKLWSLPEFKQDLGDAITALTKQFESRQGMNERATSS